VPAHSDVPTFSMSPQRILAIIAAF